jgi:hypothetical protein
MQNNQPNAVIVMPRSEVVKGLQQTRTMIVNLANGIKTKRGMRDSERAMTLAQLAKQCDAIDVAIRLMSTDDQVRAAAPRMLAVLQAVPGVLGIADRDAAVRACDSGVAGVTERGVLAAAVFDTIAFATMGPAPAVPYEQEAGRADRGGTVTGRFGPHSGHIEEVAPKAQPYPPTRRELEQLRSDIDRSVFPFGELMLNERQTLIKAIDTALMPY